MRFSLILATVRRADELERFLASLITQTYQNFELIVVDQNPDDRLVPLLAPYAEKLSILHLRSEKGLSRARNVGLKRISGDVVAFPDDDCQYPPNLLDQVAHFLVTHPDVDGLTGRTTDEDRKASLGHFAGEPGAVNKFNIWSRATSISIFLRRGSVQDLWFDEDLGVGAGTAWGAGEEFDYLLRLLDRGASLYYDPDLVVIHPPLTGSGTSSIRRAYLHGCGMGRILRMHRYPIWFVFYRWARPLGGTLLALGRGQTAKAGCHWASFRGRLTGFLRQ